MSSSVKSSTSISLLLAPSNAATISFNFRWMAMASLFCVRCIRKTMRKVMMVVPVLITNCQVSENRKNGPLINHTITTSTARRKAADVPVALVALSENCSSSTASLVLFPFILTPPPLPSPVSRYSQLNSATRAGGILARHRAKVECQVIIESVVSANQRLQLSFSQLKISGDSTRDFESKIQAWSKLFYDRCTAAKYGSASFDSDFPGSLVSGKKDAAV